MQVRKLLLQQHVVVVGAGDIAGAAGAGAAAVQRLVHGLDHARVLPHAQVVVGAPHGDRRLAALAVVRRLREVAGVAFQVREHPVVALPTQPVELLAEDGIVIHGRPPMVT